MSIGDAYWTRLRSLWGPGVLQSPGASVLITDGEDRLLLIRTGDFGQWGLVGGRIEIGEDPADAARREALEEIGCAIHLGELVGAFGGPDIEMTYANGDRTSFIIVLYRATIAEGAPVPDGVEAVDVGWFAAGDLRTLDLNPCARALLERAGTL